MRYLYLLLFLLTSISIHAQLMGFRIPNGQEKVEIPFEFQNNFIIIDLIFDDVFPLKFIFDTGSENTILVRKEFTDILDISYDRQFKLIGADQKQELTAYLVRGVNLVLPNIVGEGLDMLVLEKDYFRFEEFTGMKIHGILGMDLFRTFTIQIDYKKKILSLYKIENFDVPSKKFQVIKAEVTRNKPYINATAKINENTQTPIKLLLDTGASLSLLLHNNSTDAIKLPEKLVPGRIGNGLGGLIEGFIGRIRLLSFDKFQFNGVITNFQEIATDSLQVFKNNRNGILGNEILSRFTIIFDLPRERIYLRPIRRYNKGFKFDKSGLTIITSGKDLENFIVKDIISNSPAHQAGIQKGDRIININFIPASFMSLQQITSILQKRNGKSIRLIVKRKGEKKVFRFKLKDLI